MLIKKGHILAVLTALLLSFFTAYLVGARGTAGTSVAVDETLLSEIQALEESEGMSLAREAVSRAESSRRKIIQDSIDYSLYLIASVSESISLEESLLQASISWAARRSEAAASLAERSAIIESASAYEEEERYAAESSFMVAQAARDESIRASKEEASRQASIAASLAEESRRAAEAAAAEASRRAAEAAAAEASRRAAQTQTTASPRPTDGSVTVLIGDSRTSGFGIYGCWPAEYVFYNYSAVSTSNGLTEQAAAWSPARAIFFNGVDDLISYSPSRAAERYEEYIAHFQALSPGTAIYVCACIPVRGVALENHPQLGGIAEFNNIVRGVCSRRGWHFFDASAGLTADAYYGDGIHFTPSFTRTWMSNVRAIVGF